ncbi:hypothetical protein [Verrucosispora sp. TAA-831]|uniref:hypothetical protein n=1 Tax=Verrucosispora sp. TAA-831 TaxID=3422227 RepID=UPI003D6E52A6
MHPRHQIDGPTAEITPQQRRHPRDRPRDSHTGVPDHRYTALTCAIGGLAAVDWVVRFAHASAFSTPASLGTYVDDHASVGRVLVTAAVALIGVWAVWTGIAQARLRGQARPAPGRRRARSRNQAEGRYGTYPPSRPAPGQRTWNARPPTPARRVTAGNPDMAELDEHIAAGTARLTEVRQPPRRFTAAAVAAVAAAKAAWVGFGVHASFVLGGGATAGLVVFAVIAIIATMCGLTVAALWLSWWHAARQSAVRDQLAADRYDRAMAEISQFRAEILHEGDVLAEAALDRAQRLLDTPGKANVTEFPGRGSRGR